ncbi:MAG: dienelactone hydrolase family protein [Silvanigrellaceae bacterium]
MNWMTSVVTLSFVAFASGAAANVKGRAVAYSLDKMEFEGYLVEGGKKGNVLVVHDWMGLTDKTRAKADAVAALGYTVFAVDVFGKNVRPKTPDEALAPPKKAGQSAIYNKNQSQQVTREPLEQLPDQRQTPFARLDFRF